MSKRHAGCLFGLALLLMSSGCAPPAPPPGSTHSLQPGYNYYTNASPYISAFINDDELTFKTDCNTFSATIISNTELEWVIQPTAYCPGHMENQELLTSNMFDAFRVLADDYFTLGNLSFRGRVREVGALSANS